MSVSRGLAPEVVAAPLLEARGLVRFFGKTPALRDASLSVTAG